MNPHQVIGSIFQQYLGRAPSPAELNGFASAMQNGVVDPVGLSLFIQGSSEFQKMQVPGGVQGYQDALTKGNQNIMQQGFDQARSNFAKMGRDNSSGLDSAYAKVSGNVAAQQSPMIAQYYGNLYGNAQNPNQYGQNYLSGTQQFGAQQRQNDFTASQAAIDRQTYGDYFNRNMQQSQTNNWFQLGGSLLGAAGKGIGGALAGGYL